MVTTLEEVNFYNVLEKTTKATFKKKTLNAKYCIILSWRNILKFVEKRCI